MLQSKDIKTFQITNIKINSNSIEFFLYDKLSHSNVVINRIKCSNQHPFNKYRIGNYVGIDTSKMAKCSSSITINDSSVVAV